VKQQYANWSKNKASITIEGDTINLEEINRMRKENARLKEENEILKMLWLYSQRCKS
jgi:hypothetical protein